MRTGASSDAGKQMSQKWDAIGGAEAVVIKNASSHLVTYYVTSALGAIRGGVFLFRLKRRKCGPKRRTTRRIVHSRSALARDEYNGVVMALSRTRKRKSKRTISVGR